MTAYLRLTTLSRRTKRWIFLFLDTLLVPIALACAFLLRYGAITPPEQMMNSWSLFGALTILGCGAIHFVGLPQIKLESFESRATLRIGGCAVILAVGAMAISYAFQLGTPRSVPVIFGAFFFAFAVAERLVMLALLRQLKLRDTTQVPVAIYGAGPAGIQLATALGQSHEHYPVAFVDDAESLHGLVIAGIPVRSPKRLSDLVKRRRIKQIVIARPELSDEKRFELITSLKDLGVEIRVLPSIADMLDGRTEGNGPKVVTPDQLLGRDKVDLKIPEIGKAYSQRNVMVTGAGGSIGSELARQLLDCNCAKIVLFEHSEFALYSIEREMSALVKGRSIEVVARLGSVTNPNRVRSVMRDEKVEIVLHAAAYKHVPLVEDNELEGARNNIVGTQVVAEAATALRLERFILISTDKAVRPTNIMGASKRLAELVVQDMQTRATVTRLTMVRFGNVLGSSGSVLPLFQRQIAAGGPVTVTHPDVTRYFMTIPEAARLVLLSGAFSEGGDVFVLDMGKPMRIYDIAKKMIKMSARTVSANPGDGGIEIKITGLRPGEKLYEELLIDDDSLVPTPHEKILRAQERHLSELEVAAMLKRLRGSIDNNDALSVRQLIRDYVDGYHEQSSGSTG